MKFCLIPNWRRAWLMFSVQAMTLAGALQGAWLAVPADMKTGLPGNIVTGLSIALMVLGVVGRMVHQPVVKPEGDAS